MPNKNNSSIVLPLNQSVTKQGDTKQMFHKREREKQCSCLLTVLPFVNDFLISLPDISPDKLDPSIDFGFIAEQLAAQRKHETGFC